MGGTGPADAAGMCHEIRRLVVHQGTTYETGAVVAELLITLVAEEHARSSSRARPASSRMPP